MMPRININCDLGEGIADEEKIMPFIQSCSIAAGGHFGNELTIRNTIQLAQRHEVQIGIHPSYPDRDNFGRTTMNLTDKKVRNAIFEQIVEFIKIAQFENATVKHIKFHGALYHDVCKHQKAAEIIGELLNELPIEVEFYCLPNAQIEKLLTKNYTIVHEAFIDRSYESNLALTPRAHPDAMILEKEKAFQQLYDIAMDNRVLTRDGNYKTISAQTFCIHGDSGNALNQLKYIYQQLNNETA